MHNKFNWIENPSLMMVLNILILILVVLNFNYQFLVHVKEKENQLLEIQTNQVITNIEDLKSGINFQNSNLFKEKEIRNQGYKRPGEVMVNTSFVEPVLVSRQGTRNYIPGQEESTGGKTQRWMDCLFYGVGLVDNKVIFCRYD
jgi:hypothetical protein